ncbi:MAG: hypothetical protein AVDCRST_MAG30-4689, partial [uncultured Solirubrobacteraceae bacterium]
AGPRPRPLPRRCRPPRPPAWPARPAWRSRSPPASPG